MAGGEDICVTFDPAPFPRPSQGRAIIVRMRRVSLFLGHARYKGGNSGVAVAAPVALVAVEVREAVAATLRLVL